MTILYKIGYRLILAFFHLFSYMPLTAGRKAGALIGTIWFSIDKRHRKIAIDNLFHAYGKEKTAEEIIKIARQVFKNLSMIIFEVAWALRLNEREFNKAFYVDGLDNLIKAYNKNKGVLILTGHIGNWELVPGVIAFKTSYSSSTVYRPLDSPVLNDFFVWFRGRFGAKLIPKTRSMRNILRSLKNHELVGIFFDQNSDWYEGVFVKFFNRTACTNRGLGLIAYKTHAPVVPSFLLRTDSGFRVEFGEEIQWLKFGDKTKEIEENSQIYNDAIEECIRKYPEQWLWVHQRWKTKPYSPWPRQ